MRSVSCAAMVGDGHGQLLAPSGRTSRCFMRSRTPACLIDCQGRVWDQQSAEFQAQLCVGRCAGHAIASLAPPAGSIRIDVAARIVRVAVDPRTVSAAAVTGMITFLGDLPIVRARRCVICLSIAGCTTSARVVEMFATIKQAVNRLRFLMGESESYQQQP